VHYWKFYISDLINCAAGKYIDEYLKFEFEAVFYNWKFYLAVSSW